MESSYLSLLVFTMDVRRRKPNILLLFTAKPQSQVAAGMEGGTE